MSLKDDALLYHSTFPAGNLSVFPTKQIRSIADLSLAYTPGVAEPCREIAKDPEKVYDYTTKGNLVAMISNGTAVLGLGNIGPLASKPVMEGKSVLFKYFAGIDCFDIEINSENIDEIVQTVKLISPTFGAINLEDIKAPECFEIERRLSEELDIPVFHDDQHGTAVIVGAAVLNALLVQNKKISDIKVVILGAGAGAISCLKLLLELGVQLSNVYMFDTNGLIIKSRNDLNVYKAEFAREDKPLTLEQAMKDADLFLGLSKKDVLSENCVKVMAPNPIVLALANPDPEILPSLAHSVRSDLVMGTGRADFPNQANNSLCFPYLFRGTLDVRASKINMAMKLACVKAIAELAQMPVVKEVLEARNVGHLEFGKDYFLPSQFDPRLYFTLPPIVAEAAMKTGVARKPIADFGAYQKTLETRLCLARPELKNR